MRAQFLGVHKKEENKKGIFLRYISIFDLSAIDSTIVVTRS